MLELERAASAELTTTCDEYNNVYQRRTIRNALLMSIRSRRHTRQSLAAVPQYMENRIIVETLTSETETIVYVSESYGVIYCTVANHT